MKIKRWHARLRRRLKRRVGADPTLIAAVVGRNLRGGKVSSLVSAQGSHREMPDGELWPLDCGLCAAKNVARRDAPVADQLRTYELQQRSSCALVKNQSYLPGLV